GCFWSCFTLIEKKKKIKKKVTKKLKKGKKILFETRPTAVNLAWGLEKIMKVAKQGKDVSEIKQTIIQTAKKMAEDDIATNMIMGKHGAKLFDNNDTIMTHCNAGALAT